MGYLEQTVVDQLTSGIYLGGGYMCVRECK